MSANTTQMALTIKTQYEKRLLSRAVPRMIHAKWAEQARITKNSSLEWRKFGALSNVTSSLSEGLTPAEGTAPAITNVTATPVFYGKQYLN